MAIAEFAQKILTETSFTGIFVSRRCFLRTCLSLEGHGRRTCRRTGEREGPARDNCSLFKSYVNFLFDLNSCRTCVCRADSFSRRMFLRNSALEKGASFPPLLPQESVLQNRRKQRRLRNMASLRVAFAIACVLTVAVWRSQAFLLSRPAGATGAKFGGFESHAARVVTLKSGPPPPQAEKPTLIEAGAFDGPAAKAIASPGNSEAGFEVAAVAPFSLSFHGYHAFDRD